MGLFKKLSGNKKKMLEEQQYTIYNPIAGMVTPLSEVNDPVFAEEMMGKGVAIKPSVGQVVAPMDGQIISVFRTMHAVTMIGDNGAEIIIHVGLDTVKLGGEYYSAHVSDGMRVKKGDLMLTFDLEQIEALGYDLITPIIVTNSADFDAIENMATGSNKVGTALIKLK